MAKNKKQLVQQTNGWDALIAFGNGFFNLLKIEKICCLILMYTVIRDAVFSSFALKKGVDYEKYMIDKEFLEKLLNACDGAALFIAIIVFLAIIILILIAVIIFVYKKEIDRMAGLRSVLLHDIEDGKLQPLKKHHSSK